MLKIITISLSFFILILILELVRKEKLTFKYALGWISVSVLAVLLAIFDNILFAVARWFGFELPSNFIFFTLLAVFVFLALLMTVFLCQQNNRNDAMAQKIGMLEFELEQLKEKFKKEK